VQETLPAGTWTINDTVKFAEALAQQGAIGVIDVSSGGAHPAQKIDSFPGFQVLFAVAIKKAMGDKLAVAAVGMLDTAELANKIFEEDRLDFALAGRGFLKNPNLVWKLLRSWRWIFVMLIRFAGRSPVVVRRRTSGHRLSMMIFF
jgi:2,4-dienoyl-CoA reductase-like NADH-dependent reductase (Old Yellow Enzyme family)